MNFDRSSENLVGFVDFMAFQTQGASIRKGEEKHQGNAFYEYLVSDVGRIK